MEMEKRGNMKKIPFLFLFVFCFTTLFGGVFGVAQVSYATNETTESTVATSSDESVSASANDGLTWSSISSAQALKMFIEGSSGRLNENIRLTADIHMTDLPEADRAVLATIGSASGAFQGRFDGNGFTIYDLTIDLTDTATSSSTQSVGLFGATNGATIFNLALGGTFTIITDSASTLNVGLVGSAVNTTFDSIQIGCSYDVQTTLNQNVNFGGVAGSARDCHFSNIIVRNRNSNLSSWTFDLNDGRISTIGGIVGRMQNSEIKFAVLQTTIGATFAETFVGNVSIGGVVGNVSETTSRIVNVAIENTYSIENNAGSDATINVGEVAGLVSTQVPNASNIGYIRYHENSGIERFGAIEGQSQISYTNITVSVYSLSNLQQQDGEYQYFAPEIWHPLEGEWNFDSMWYVSSGQITLQNFYNSFDVSVSSSLNTNVLTLESLTNLSTTSSQDGFRYGNSVQMTFSFVEGMDDFYYVSALVLDGVEIAQIDVSTSYISDSENYVISTTETGFVITIRSLSMATSGIYNILTPEKPFSATISSRLFDEDGEEVENVQPGFVYLAESPSTSLRELTLNRITYGQTYRLDTRAETGTPYAFVEWCLVTESGEIQPLTTTNSILEFTFGQGDFSSDLQIFARYTVDACNITCMMDGGVLRVVFSDTIEVTQNETVVAVSKSDQSLRMEIYVEKGYNFDVQQFITEFDIYKSDDNSTFCELRETRETDEYVCYHFVLDMTTLRGDYADSFSINVRTTADNSNDNSWIWWVVGGVCGGLVLIGIIILIVVLVRRRGGGSGKMKSSGPSMKKTYKNMYF